MWPLPKPVPVQRSSSYGGSFVGGGTAAVPRSARRWARSAHLHEVRRARHHHHHHHHNHNHNHHGVNVSAAADLTGSGENESENESADDVFAAAPSRGSHIQSTAPVAGYFGTDDALVRMWMRARTQLDERGDGDGDGDEGGAGTDTWVDTDTDADVDASTGTGTDADADDDSAYGVWPGPGEVD
jgi:hypothetical protein